MKLFVAPVRLSLKKLWLHVRNRNHRSVASQSEFVIASAVRATFFLATQFVTIYLLSWKPELI